MTGAPPFFLQPEETVGSLLWFTDGERKGLLSFLEVYINIMSNGPVPVVPVAAFSATPRTGTALLTVSFSDASSGTAPLTYAWDFQNDGSVDSTLQSPMYIHTSPGTYTVNLTVTGTGGSDNEIKTDYVMVIRELISSGIGVVRNRNLWLLDASGDGRYGAGDLVYTFGKGGDAFVTGIWS